MLHKTELLLLETKHILQKQQNIRKAQGENFNIFSILKMERLENRTHSAFIAELLNPRGAHEKGNVFLKLFLARLQKQNIDANSCTVNAEYSIGKVNNENFTGGRLDILIRDRNNKTICIENKIDAGDGFAQLLRYSNFNKGANRVCYLTLFGKIATEYSKKSLEEEEDFDILSYKDDILDWLNDCLKESIDNPSVLQSLKQYILLIKKITNSMDDTETKELNLLMLKYFEESESVAANFYSFKASIGEEIRQLVISELKMQLSKDFNIHPGNNANYHYSQIWIKYKEFDNAKQFFGVESFSYLYDGDLDVGIFNIGGKQINYSHNSTKGETNYWPYYKRINHFDGISVNFNDKELLTKLFLDDAFKHKLVSHIVIEIFNFIDIHKESLLTFLKNSIKE